MIKIDFEDAYPLDSVAGDLSAAKFTSPTRNGQLCQLSIEITRIDDRFLSDVVNLAFGPLTEAGVIDDQAKIHHSSLSKTFSTIILFAYTFLKANQTLSIGVDGSDDTRAYLYHKMFITNRRYLGDYFIASGVDWYVRLQRNGSIKTDEEGNPYLKPEIAPFDYSRNLKDLYGYYIFRLKSENQKK